MNIGQLCSSHCAILPADFSEVVKKRYTGVSGGPGKSMKIMAKNCWRQTMGPNNFLYHFI